VFFEKLKNGKDIIFQQINSLNFGDFTTCFFRLRNKVGQIIFNLVEYS